MGDGTLDLAKQILREVPKIKLVIYGRAFGSSKNMSAREIPGFIIKFKILTQNRI